VIAAEGKIALDARDMIIGCVDNWGMQPWICREY